MDVSTRGSTHGQSPGRTIRCAHGPVGREGVLDAGDLIAGRFRVQQLLASGGMGNIYSGYCEASDRRVVLKVPRPLNGEGDEFYARFLQEVRATSLLRGEHVVHSVADGVLATGVPFLALEHLDGMDLRAVLRETGRLPVPLAVDYARQACLGLCEVHALGFVHRDVKPANLFLAAHPTGPARIRLIDFGVAKWTGDAAADLSLTNTSMLLGSAPYVSPEQLRDSASVDARTDVWALGVVLFELLMGARPFGGSSAADLCAQILMRPAPALRSERSEIAPELDAIVRRCLEKARQDRFSSALELHEALRRFSSHSAPAHWEVSGRSTLGSAPVPSLRSSGACAPGSRVLSGALESRSVYGGADDAGVGSSVKAAARADEGARAEWPSSHAPLVAAPAQPRPRRSRWRYPVAAAITMLGATLVPTRHGSSPAVRSILDTARAQSTSAADSPLRSQAAAAIDTSRGAGNAALQRSDPNRVSGAEARVKAPAAAQQAGAASRQLTAAAEKPVPSGPRPPPALAPKRPPARKQPTTEAHGSNNDEVDFGI